MRRRALLIVLFIASLLAVPAVQAENNSETVLAQGVAPITGENIAAARQAAIQDLKWCAKNRTAPFSGSKSRQR